MASQRQDRAWLGFLYRIVWLFLILLYRQIEKEEAILFFLLLHFPTTNASSVGGSFPFCRDDGRRFFLFFVSFFLLTWNSVTGCRLLMTPTNRKGSEKATKRMGKKWKEKAKQWESLFGFVLFEFTLSSSPCYWLNVSTRERKPTGFRVRYLFFLVTLGEFAEVGWCRPFLLASLFFFDTSFFLRPSHPVFGECRVSVRANVVRLSLSLFCVPKGFLSFSLVLVRISLSRRFWVRLQPVTERPCRSSITRD